VIYSYLVRDRRPTEVSKVPTSERPGVGGAGGAAAMPMPADRD